MKFIVAALLLTSVTALEAFIKKAVTSNPLAKGATNPPGPTKTALAVSATIVNRGVWVPDVTAFAYGLPGALEPIGVFDPLGLLPTSVDEVKRFREAEVTHGRVAMLASVGFLIGESFHPLFGLDGKEILAIDSLTEVRQVFPAFFEVLAVAIGAAELYRAKAGWTEPYDRISSVKSTVLNSAYYPGDIGFDPLGLKPKTSEGFVEMQNKELQNGRLAMLAIAGFVAQELVDHKPILLNDFGI